MPVSTLDVPRQTYTSTAAAPLQRLTSRVASVDFVRGVVMVLMAIDHVRVYSGVPAGGPAPSIFFTRWMTHFVAPAFVCLAGTAAYLHWLVGNHPMAPPPVPAGYTWSLGLLYTVFAICVIALYFPCRWFARVRAARRAGWMSYL